MAIGHVQRYRLMQNPSAPAGDAPHATAVMTPQRPREGYDMVLAYNIPTVRRQNDWQGVGNPLADEERQFSDRVEEYDVYNDLGRLPRDPGPDDVINLRPVLGGMTEVLLHHGWNSRTLQQSEVWWGINDQG